MKIVWAALGVIVVWTLLGAIVANTFGRSRDSKRNGG